VNPDLGRRLYDLQRELDTVAPGGIPQVISVLLFTDDERIAFRQYVAELERWLQARGAGDTVLVEIVQLAHRPAGLRAPWIFPRPWLEYRPSPEELAQLRPDTVGPREPRADYTAPGVGPARRVLHVAPLPSPSRDSEGIAGELTEDEHRVREARARWRKQLERDGTPGADRAVGGVARASAVRGTAATGTSSNASPTASSELSTFAAEGSQPSSQAGEALSLGGGRPRRVSLSTEAGVTGPLGSGGAL